MEKRRTHCCTATAVAASLSSASVALCLCLCHIFSTKKKRSTTVSEGIEMAKPTTIPADGYEAFLNFLFEVPSQSELKAREDAAAGVVHTGVVVAPSPPASVSVGDDALEHAPKPVSPHSKRYHSARFADADKEWDVQVQALREFRADNGSCDVPFGRETGSLRSWAERQRKLHARGELDQDKVDELKVLDFDFTVRRLSTRSTSGRASLTKVVRA